MENGLQPGRRFRRWNLALIIVAAVAGTATFVVGETLPVPGWVGGAGVAAVFLICALIRLGLALHQVPSNDTER